MNNENLDNQHEHNVTFTAGSTQAKKQAKKEKRKMRDARRAWLEEKEKIFEPVTKHFSNRITFKRLLIAIVAVIVFAWIGLTVLPMVLFSAVGQKSLYFSRDNKLTINDRTNRELSDNLFLNNYIDNTGSAVSKMIKLQTANIEPVYKKSTIVTYQNVNIDNKTADLVVIKNNNQIFNTKNVLYENVKISDEMDSILYIKNENSNNNLYLYDFNKEILLSNSISSFYSDKNINYIFYVANAETYVYANHKNADANKSRLLATKSYIVNDTTTDIKYQNILEENGFNNFYIAKYTDNTNINIYKINNISQNIDDIKLELVLDKIKSVGPYFQNENYMYLFKDGVQSLNISNYVIDDISDGSFFEKEPKIENYNSNPFDSFMNPFGGFGGFGGLFDNFLNPFQNVPDYSSYNADKKAYDAVKDYVEKNKETIEKYKNQISGGTYDKQIQKLYCYDGNKLDSFCDERVKSIKTVQGVQPYVFLEVYSRAGSNVEKVNLSSIIYSNITIDDYMKSINVETETLKYIFYRDMGMRIANLNGTDYEVYSGKDKFLIKSTNGLYSSIYSVDKKFGETVSINVEGEQYLTNELRVINSPYFSDIIYVVKNGNGNATMYYNDNQLSTTINSENIFLSNDLKKIYYFTEFNMTKNTGTLNIYDSEKNTDTEKFRLSVLNNVLMPSIKSNAVDSSLYYITDFDSLSCYGALYRYNIYDKKQKISDKVNTVLNTNVNEERLKTYNKKPTNYKKKTMIGADFGENYFQNF